LVCCIMDRSRDLGVGAVGRSVLPKPEWPTQLLDNYGITRLLRLVTLKSAPTRLPPSTSPRTSKFRVQIHEAFRRSHPYILPICQFSHYKSFQSASMELPCYRRRFYAFSRYDKDAGAQPLRKARIPVTVLCNQYVLQTIITAQ
jgi:hypothetical protein